MNWKCVSFCACVVSLLSAGCAVTTPEQESEVVKEATVAEQVVVDEVPCEIPQEVVDDAPCVTAPKIANEQKGPKQMWATSFIWTKSPELKVEKWLSEKPDTKGKYILLEFWNTWCPPCRRSLVALNKYHEKFKDELTVIALTDETEEAVAEMKSVHGVDAPKCHSAIDTSAFTKKEYGVTGVPHVVIIEPFEGFVVWEGFPGLKGYELTEEKIEKILSVGRKIRQANSDTK